MLWITPIRQADQQPAAHTPQQKGYSEATTTPGLWNHQWRPIQLCLTVDDFVIEYVGERHIHHLRDVLKHHYKITKDLTGTKFGGIHIRWNYAPKHSNRTFRLCIKYYIKDLMLQLGHTSPPNPQLSPHTHHDIMYGANPQMAHIEDTILPLDEVAIKRIQAIVGAVLLYGRAVDKKLLVTLN